MHESSSYSTILPVFFFIILRGMQWYFTMILIYISLLIKNAEHLFMYLFDVCIYCLVNCLQIFCPYFNRLFVCLLLSFEKFFYIFWIHLLGMCFAVIYSQCVVWLFIFLTVSFTENIFNMDEVPVYQFIVFYGLYFWCHSSVLCLTHGQKIFSHGFF